MKRKTSSILIAVAMAIALVASACGRDEDSSSPGAGDNGGGDNTAAPDGKAGPPSEVPGFDGTTIKLGVLTPLTGPAAIIGKPLTEGNKVFWQMINDQGGLDGKYKVELVIKDNKYTPQDTITQYNQVKGDVVAFQQILGTAPLEALLPQLREDNGFAGPATLDAQWYEEKNLMPILATYQIQAINSLDFYVNEMDGKGTKMCTLTSNNPYGAAGKEGADFAIDKLGESFAAQETFSSGQGDYTAQISALQNAGCEMVWLTALPTEASPILKRAIEVGFAPQWIGQSPTWVGVLPALVGNPQYLADNFVLAAAGVEWGDTSAPGMKQMLDAVTKFAPDQAPDLYFSFGWLQANAMSQILLNAIKAGDLSKEGIINGMAATDELDFGGMALSQPYGLPKERKPGQDTTFLAVTPDTAETNGGLSVVNDAATSYVSKFVKDFKHD